MLIPWLEKIDKRINDGEDVAVIFPYLIHSKKIVLSDYCGYQYRIHQNSVCNKKREDAYRNALKQLFSSINRENQASVFQRLEELVINYASGNSDDQDVRNVVRMQTQAVRDNVQNYWGKLFEL